MKENKTVGTRVELPPAPRAPLFSRDALLVSVLMLLLALSAWQASVPPDPHDHDHECIQLRPSRPARIVPSGYEFLRLKCGERVRAHCPDPKCKHVQQ